MRQQSFFTAYTDVIALNKISAGSEVLGWEVLIDFSGE